MPRRKTGVKTEDLETKFAPDAGKHREKTDSASLAPNRTRILLVDDHPFVRHGVKLGLARHPGLEIVGDAAGGEDALRKARELLPALVLMDIDLPQINGLALTELLRKELPQIKVLLLSMSGNPEYVPRILQSGARGFILKDAPMEELVQAIETVVRGDTYFSPEIARQALHQMLGDHGNGPRPEELTAREREVLIEIANGLSNKEIATRLGIGTRTVETHRENLMRKLNVHSIGGLTKYALAKGLVILRENSGRRR